LKLTRGGHALFVIDENNAHIVAVHPAATRVHELPTNIHVIRADIMNALEANAVHRVLGPIRALGQLSYIAKSIIQ
jgi:hypothetical protein